MRASRIAGKPGWFSHPITTSLTEVIKLLTELRLRQVDDRSGGVKCDKMTDPEKIAPDTKKKPNVRSQGKIISDVRCDGKWACCIWGPIDRAAEDAIEMDGQIWIFLVWEAHTPHFWLNADWSKSPERFQIQLLPELRALKHSTKHSENCATC